ncbi:MAG: 3'-5' exonuclease domain-containing protein 2, partial [Bacteroidales bacterium]|nr:3'-5' exonuclease domain-containing protein 2 [Bacteroidales bacterium]
MKFKSSITTEELQELEIISFPGKIHLIEEEDETYRYAIRYLSRQRLIGFDTETRPSFTATQPKHEVALLQLAGDKEAFLFRINLLGMKQHICDILSDPHILKVGAAVLDDIRGLERYVQFEPANFVDLQKMAGDWGI